MTENLDIEKITVAQAKRMCMAKWGKLPSVGSESLVYTDSQGNTCYLQNISGTYRIFNYYPVRNFFGK